MDVLTTYLLDGASGQGGVPYKLWVLSSSPSSVEFGPNDSIILGGFVYTASPYTSQRNAGVGVLDSNTDTILWNKRYVVGHSFNGNQSTYFGRPYYNSSANKVWFGATYDSIVTLNPSTGAVLNSASPDTSYQYNVLNAYTSDVQNVYGTTKQDNYTVKNFKFTIGSSSNTNTVNWYSTWSNTGGGAGDSNISLRSQGAVYATGNKAFHMLDIYDRNGDRVAHAGIVATNSDGTNGGSWKFNMDYAQNNINEPFGGIFRDYSGNIYISKGFAARNGSFPNRRLVSYNSSMGHRYTYYPSLPGYVSSGNPNLNIVVLGSDSSNNLYLGVGTMSAGSGGAITRIAKVNQSGTILWQYSSNTGISSVNMHPTDSEAILILFSNGRIMTQKASGLITGTWGSLTISQTSDLSLVSDSEYWSAVSGGGAHQYSMTYSSQSVPGGSVLSSDSSDQGLSVTSTTTIA